MGERKYREKGNWVAMKPYDPAADKPATSDPGDGLAGRRPVEARDGHDSGKRAGKEAFSAQAPPQSKGILVLCWIALVGTIVCNGLFEAMKLGGTTSASVSNQVFAWFAPAGYVFAIWGVIYAALSVWLGIATWKSRQQMVLSAQEAMLFSVSCVLNVMWLVAFHYLMIAASLLLILFLWCVVAALYAQFRRRRAPMWTRVPFSLYLGWLTVAVVANTAHLATRSIEIPLFVNQVSTVILVVAVLAVGYVMAHKLNDYVFPLVIGWATIGVGVHLMDNDPMVAAVVIGLSVLGLLVTYVPLVAKRSAERTLTAR